MDELELFKLLVRPKPNDVTIHYVCDFAWVDEKFLVWVYYDWLNEFIDGLVDIFGEGIFNNGGFDGNFQKDCVCIDLCPAIGEAVNLEEIFPKSEYEC